MIVAATHQPLDLGSTARGLLLEPLASHAGLEAFAEDESESWEAIG